MFIQANDHTQFVNARHITILEIKADITADPARYSLVAHLDNGKSVTLMESSDLYAINYCAKHDFSRWG